MLDDLLAHPGVIEEAEVRGPVGLLAFHGGSLERGTDVVARLAAERAGATYYAIRQPDDLRWHVPSTRIDPAHSPTLAAVLDHIDVAVAVHGYGRDGHWTTLLLGGSNRDLAAHLRAHLAPALPDYTVVDRIDDIPRELRGLHADNPVNRPRRGGVQLELPPRVRGMGPFWDGDGPLAPGRLRPHTEALVAALAAALATW